MSSGDDVTVVWVAPPPAASTGTSSGSGARDGREDAERALEQWARARGLRIVTAGAAGGDAGHALRVDLAIGERVEKELVRAREAIAALEADAAERALARAEALLHEHPELPQAAWLRAEVHRSWAARWTRIEPRDDQRAQLAWQDAEALDGGRVAGVGEVAFTPRPRTAALLTVQGAPGRRVVARFDGSELAGATSADGVIAYPLEVPAAEHQLVVTLDGDAVFASWVSIAAGSPGTPRPTIPVRIGDDGPCTASALSGVSLAGTSRAARTSREPGEVRAPGVTCDRWVAAAPSERRGAVLVARCAGSTCGSFVEWRSDGGLLASAPGDSRAPDSREGLPAWATWTAIGVGAVAAATIAVIATGVLETRPTEERFVAGGVRIE